MENMTKVDKAFTQWFQQATGCTPYPFQIRFACGDWLRHAVPVPSDRDPSPLCRRGQG
jgi:hypothetical protein